MSSVEFFDDPAAFRQRAGGFLAANALTAIVLTSKAAVPAPVAAAGVGDPRRHWYWFACISDASGTVVGTAMRTATFAPQPLFLPPMPAWAAIELARAVHERGEWAGGANGARPAIDEFAAETARLHGLAPDAVQVSMRTRLHELGGLRPPVVPVGQLRPATAQDLDLVQTWWREFETEADAQARGHADAQSLAGPDAQACGHAEAQSLAGADSQSLARGVAWADAQACGHGHDGHIDLYDDEAMLRRIAQGQVRLWRVDGEAVHLTGYRPPAYGVARIGPVYTPRAHRGHGYAAAAVAQVSQELLDAGARVCLYTDQANPVSNALYARLGFIPVTDMANLLLRR